ncbi:MAG: transcriptional regulator [Actinobacteria bacterium]|nr:transcriptional regulator [Actinomycetota bacterium]
MTGSARDEIAAQLRKDYENGTTLRDLAASSGRSYGFVHRVLTQAGVTLRPRGGNVRQARVSGGK